MHIENLAHDLEATRRPSPTPTAPNNLHENIAIAAAVSNGDDSIPNRPDLQKYLSSRRHTFAVALNPQEVERMSTQNNDAVNIPEISRRSPTPPPGDQRRLSYKEQFLPCPAVLQVRPSYDRRASDGSASIQSSIAQFHALRKARKAFNQVSNHDDSSGGSNQSSMEQLLGVPAFKEDDKDSGSDQEPDLEAVARYLKGRGRQQRHTLGCTIDPSAALPDGLPDPFCQLPQRRATRERERASPIPYSPGMAGSSEGRRYLRRSSEGNTGAALKASLGQGGERPDPMKHLQAEFMKLQQLYGNKGEQQQHPRQRRSQNHLEQQIRKRDAPARHSYPTYQDMQVQSYEEVMTQDEETTPASEVPGEDGNPNQAMRQQDVLLLLRMKQEEEMQRLHHEQLLKHKLLLKRQQEEQRELIRRASGGSPNLEASIETFLKMRGLATEHKQVTAEIGAPTSNAFQQQPEQLQEQMQRLNLRIPEMTFVPVGTAAPAQVNPVTFQSPFPSHQTSAPSMPHDAPLRGHTRQKSAPVGAHYSDSKQMDIDVSRLRSDCESSETDTFPSIPQPEFPQAPMYFPFANINMHPLFAPNSVAQSTAAATAPLSPRLGMSVPTSQALEPSQIQRLIQNNNNSSIDTNASDYWTSMLHENAAKERSSPEAVGDVYINNNSNVDVALKEATHPLRTAISYDMISEKEIAFIVVQIQRALDERQQSGLDYNQSDSYFSLFGNGVQMEIEVSNVPGSDLNGIKLRRVDGDTWVYKKLCNELLSVIKV